MKQIEQLGKLLPFGSIFLVLCSSVKLVMFYRIFNIPIVEYIGISEYLTLFIDDILYYLTLFGVGLCLYLFNTDFTIETTKVKVDYKQNIKPIIFIVLIEVIIIILIFFLCNNTETISHKFQIIGVGIYTTLNLLYVLSSKINFTFPYPIFILLSILLYCIMDGNADGYKKIENAGKSKNIIEFKDRKIVTSEKLVYLGKTEKYFFLFEIETKTAVIIPNENVIQLKLK